MKNDKRIRKVNDKSAMLLLLICLSGILMACGQESVAENGEQEGVTVQFDETFSGDKVGDTTEDSSLAEDNMDNNAGQMIPEAEDLKAEAPEAEDPEAEGPGIAESHSQTPETSQPDNTEAVPRELDAMQELFGADCISEQTFEVQLSEYEQKVYFVPFAPSLENPQFRIQLIQDGQVLKELEPYVPKKLAGESFGSLDAVCFYDLNYDGNTDILLLETYGDTRFAAFYYGDYDSYYSFTEEGIVEYVYFFVEEELSEQLSGQVSPLTISEIFGFLADGKKNGEFSDYQEAYEAVSRVYDLDVNMGYNLIYFDEDDIPELVVGVNGYWMSMFTYDAGRVYCLSNVWRYGAFGIPGYEYVPGKNSLRRYDSDSGANQFHINYWAVGEQHAMEEVAWIMYDNYLEDENEATGESCTVYVNGEEIPEDEEIDYDVGEYEWIDTTLSREELLEKLKH